MAVDHFNGSNTARQTRELPPSRRPRAPRGGIHKPVRRRDQPKRDGRKLLCSTTQALLDLLADNLGGVYGPNAHLATLGEALVTMWAAPFKQYNNNNSTRTAYKNSREDFSQTLEKIFQDIKDALLPELAPEQRLQEAARILAQAR